MRSASDVLEQAINTVENSEGLEEEEKKLLKNDLVHELRSAENIGSGYTLKKHVSKLRRISEENPSLNLADPDISKELNKKVRNQIQASKFKRGSGEFSKRNKRDYWIAWKYLLKHIHDIDLDSDKVPGYKPSSNEEDVEKQADTRPEDLPNRRDMKQLLNSLESVSHGKIAKRNTAFFLFLWDTGARKGEALQTKMKHVSVHDNVVKVEVQGNKQSKDRKIRVFQGEEYLRQYIKTHPAKDDGEAYLFPKLYNEEYRSHMSDSALKKKLVQARSTADLSFKIWGEPFHIFRKAMTTYYRTNDILSWEEICERQGKKVDSTKPDYLLQAISDVDASAAEGFGISEQRNGDEKRMKGEPLLPVNCVGCGRRNHCLRENCVECSKELPESEMPKNITEEKEDEIEQANEDELRQALDKLEKLEDQGLI